MLTQQNITFLDELPTLPTGPTHYTQLDLAALVSARLDAIADELLEAGSDIPCDVVFMIESLGGVVDLRTGYVTAEIEGGTDG